MAIDLISGGNAATTHAYYRKEDFLRHDRERGVLEERVGVRGLLVTEDFMVGLQSGLEEEVGDSAGLIMYRSGFEWAMQDMKAFEERFAREFGGRTKMTDENVMFVLESWWWPLTAEGWGTWSVDFSQRKQGLIFVDLFDSAVAKSLGNIGKPVCFMYAGLLSGMFSYFSRHELSGVEIQCYAMGEDYCKFIVGAEKQVKAAAFWVEEGASAKEVVEKLG